jgi:hypothetical protein
MGSPAHIRFVSLPIDFDFLRPSSVSYFCLWAAGGKLTVYESIIAMFRALLQSDSKEDLERKAPSSLMPKNLPYGIHPSYFFHILIRRENAYLRRVLIAVVLIPETQEQVHMAEY